MNRQQERAARMIAKGFSYKEAAAAIGIGVRQVERWMSPTKGLPGFRQRVEQLREDDPEPGADDVLRQALSATRPSDGLPDWPSRIAAAKALRLQPPDPSAANDDGVRQVVIYFNRDADGNPILRPPTPDADAETIEGEAVEIPPPSGHGILPPGPAA